MAHVALVQAALVQAALVQAALVQAALVQAARRARYSETHTRMHKPGLRHAMLTCFMNECGKLQRPPKLDGGLVRVSFDCEMEQVRREACPDVTVRASCAFERCV